MILHTGERVYWGAPEVIYLEGTVIRLDETAQTVVVHIDRATPNSAHLIGEDLPFAADGLAPLQGESPAGITSERTASGSRASATRARAGRAARLMWRCIKSMARLFHLSSAKLLLRR